MSNVTSYILLVQLYANGDCLYATTLARQIKHDYPGCHLTWAISPSCKSIIDLNPYVDAVRLVPEVPKNDEKAFRKFRKKIFAEKKTGKWNEVFMAMNAGPNLALYDGTIRGMIFRTYPRAISVPLQPVLVLSETEKKNVAEFAAKHQLHTFRRVILWEYAPQSGQVLLHADWVKHLAKKITSTADTCVILSSANRFESSGKIIDASTLSVRENAALTHYCNLLIGCSSGITWLSTSSAAKQLPMIQLLNPDSMFMNAPSVDFLRYGIDASGLIEMTTINTDHLVSCLQAIEGKGFATAKAIYNEQIPVHFKTSRNIAYNLLCYLDFGCIFRHFKIMTGFYGYQPALIGQFVLAFLEFPFRLIKNCLKKLK
ncbi:MAG: hypothetical protein NTZ41_03105 [Sphingobacteriales bacterium]|nr:hypothetical protein [Sphingobacteriales bacterium]